MKAWVWVLIVCVVLGAIIGAIASKRDDPDSSVGAGAATGAFMGLSLGASCLFEILVAGLTIAAVVWLFNALF